MNQYQNWNCTCDNDSDREPEALLWQKRLRDASLRLSQDLASEPISNIETQIIIRRALQYIIEIVNWPSSTMFESLITMCQANPWLIASVKDSVSKRFRDTLRINFSNNMGCNAAVVGCNAAVVGCGEEKYYPDFSTDDSKSDDSACDSDASSYGNRISLDSFNWTPSSTNPELGTTCLPVGSDSMLFISIAGIGE